MKITSKYHLSCLSKHFFLLTMNNSPHFNFASFSVLVWNKHVQHQCKADVRHRHRRAVSCLNKELLLAYWMSLRMFFKGNTSEWGQVSMETDHPPNASSSTSLQQQEPSHQKWEEWVVVSGWADRKTERERWRIGLSWVIMRTPTHAQAACLNTTPRFSPHKPTVWIAFGAEYPFEWLVVVRGWLNLCIWLPMCSFSFL